MKIIDALFQDPPKRWHFWNPLTGFVGGVISAQPLWLTFLLGPVFFFAWIALLGTCLVIALNRITKHEDH